jgi:L-rhamnose mutarotase
MSDKQIYQAYCKEAGEHFYFLFKTAEKSEDKVKQIAEIGASKWGAECYNIQKLNPDQVTQDDKVADMDE